MIFYEIKINYQRQTGEDNPGNVKETYLVEGLNCADVETRLTEQLKPYIFGDMEIPSCTKRQFFDIFPSTADGKWYKARVEMITIEDSGKETRKGVSILVQAVDVLQALHRLQKEVGGYDCEVVSITRSPILEVMRAGD